MLFFRTIYVARSASGAFGKVVAGRISVWSRVGGGGVGEWGIPGAGIGEWVADSGIRGRGFRESGMGGAGNGVRETGIGKSGFPDSRNSGIREIRGFGIDGCAHLCTETGNSAEFTPGNPRKRPPETPRKPPN